ncbi:reticulon-4-interacting protein 1, mitochondrial-like [Chelonus insularis]|uniref:reticulon-4-interacting protein 1, mitochondrial-like n=1 Tax=Chelonus insularis TaxID=460826 RepID=UPI00158A627F|nr:reticulon-4-interacting protein 1, mitochondrial-like [Chelonus insularis]XP_034943215.1 reticulon-4-interacting protein 1, mitochondrial-like [Chelonus insularis]
MDEIWFRLSSQLEVLQIEGTAAAQQMYHLLVSWLSQSQQALQSMCNEGYGQHLKDLGSNMLVWNQKVWEQIQFGYYNAQINSRELYRQIESLFSGEVSKRDVTFCTVGLIIGTLIGYNIGLNWRQNVKRIHYMRAVICHHYSGIEGVSVIDDAEVPSLQQSNELLIQVKAASVNVVDAKICSGYSKAYRRVLNSGQQKELPVVLGRDCAGVVVDIGQSVVGFDVGDEVFLAVPSWASGTMSEYLIATENQVAKKPKLLSFEAAACLPYSGCIAWDALVNQSRIEEGNAKGKRVLVYGASTPVGCILVQLVKLWGGHVSAICKLEAAKVIKALGADDIIPLNDCDIEKELELYDKYHVIFYTNDRPSDYYKLKRRVMPYGSFVSTIPQSLASDSFGFVSGSIFSGCIRIRLLFQYMCGSSRYQWNEGSKIKPTYLEILRELVDADQLQSVVGAAFKPNHIEQALNHVLSPDVIGSTIIKFK